MPDKNTAWALTLKVPLEQHFEYSWGQVERLYHQQQDTYLFPAINYFHITSTMLSLLTETPALTRMPDGKLLKGILYRELASGRGLADDSISHFEDVWKCDMKAMCMNT